MRREFDVAICGAGMVGAAVAYGLLASGQRLLMLDGADADFRAAKANFGLLWVQGKGFGHPHYQRLSRRAAAQWPAFCQQLQDETGMALDCEQRGGLNFIVGEDQWDPRAQRMEDWHAQAPEQVRCTELLERAALERLTPGVKYGPDVVGAVHGLLDGHVNPLRLLAALQHAYVKRGGAFHQGHAVSDIQPLTGGGFHIQAGAQQYQAARVVIAAGLGSSALAEMVGLSAPLRPQRGQILVTERVAPVLPLPASGIRQTGEGSIMVGLTQEEVGYDLSTTTSAAVRMSRQAIRVLPALSQVRWVRQWSCLRIMTPDGCPIYAESSHYPGAFLALCHSGVTLASFHAQDLARAVSDGRLPVDLQSFHHGRFNVPQTT